MCACEIKAKWINDLLSQIVGKMKDVAAFFGSSLVYTPGPPLPFPLLPFKKCVRGGPGVQTRLEPRILTTSPLTNTSPTPPRRINFPRRINSPRSIRSVGIANKLMSNEN